MDKVIKEVMSLPDVPERLKRKRGIARRFWGLKKMTGRLRERFLCDILIRKIIVDMHHLGLNQLLEVYKSVSKGAQDA